MKLSILGGFIFSIGAAAVLSGCGGSQSPIGGPGAIPESRVTLATQKSKTFLYVGILSGRSKANFLVYAIDGSKPVRKFDLYWGVQAMAIDRWGDIYTTNGFPTGGSITAFTPGGRSVLLSFIAYPVNALAFDRLGHLYAASVGVAEYRPRSRKVIRGLGEGIHNPDAVAVDGSGNVYVASDSSSSSGLGKGSIEIFPPHGEQPLRKIERGIDTPVALTFDTSGNLYVANCPRCYHGGLAGSVTEYAPGSGRPMRTLRDGINTPDALAVGPNNVLFVANRPEPIGKTVPTTVTVYAATGRKTTATITDGIKNPVSLAVDDDGDLYVANRGAGTVTVYAPNEVQPLRTITAEGVNQIAIGKE